MFTPFKNIFELLSIIANSSLRKPLFSFLIVVVSSWAFYLVSSFIKFYVKYKNHSKTFCNSKYIEYKNHIRDKDDDSLNYISLFECWVVYEFGSSFKYVLKNISTEAFKEYDQKPKNVKYKDIKVNFVDKNVPTDLLERINLNINFILSTVMNNLSMNVIPMLEKNELLQKHVKLYQYDKSYLRFFVNEKQYSIILNALIIITIFLVRWVILDFLIKKPAHFSSKIIINLTKSVVSMFVIILKTVLKNN